MVRIIADKNFKNTYCTWVGDFNERLAQKADYVVIKIHERAPLLAREAWKTLTTVRDVRDILCSMKDMGWWKANMRRLNVLAM